MPTDPNPIGSANNSEEACSPCASQPVDCEKDIVTLQSLVCSLEARYAELSRKYGMLQSKLATQATSLKQFLDEQANLRRLISELDGGDSGCSGLDDAESVDGIIGCDSGSQKSMGAPGCGGAIRSLSGKWRAFTNCRGIHMLDSPQTLTIPGTTSGLNDYDEVLAKAGSCKIWAILKSHISVSAGSGVANGGNYFASSDGVNVSSGIIGSFNAFDGHGSLENSLSIIPISDDQIVTTLGQSGSGATKSPLLWLLGYIW